MFKEFAMGGNVIDMAVGIIIGAAFGTIVNSLVVDILMPPIGLLLGGIDFNNLFYVIKQGATAGPYDSLAAPVEPPRQEVLLEEIRNAIVNK